MLVIIGTLGFPTTLLLRVQDNLKFEDPIGNADFIKKVNKWIFYCFVGGVFKDHDSQTQNNFYFVFIALFLGLVFEKQSINWLSNRWGCTFNKV